MAAKSFAGKLIIDAAAGTMSFIPSDPSISKRYSDGIMVSITGLKAPIPINRTSQSLELEEPHCNWRESRNSDQIAVDDTYFTVIPEDENNDKWAVTDGSTSAEVEKFGSNLACDCREFALDSDCIHCNAVRIFQDR